MKKLLVLLLLSLSTPVFGLNQFNLVIGREETKSVAVGLVRKADYAAVSVSLRSDQRDSEVRNEEVNRARQLLVTEANKNQRIIAKVGAPVLTSRDVGKLSSYNSPESRATVVLYYPVETNSIYQASREIKQFVKGLKLSDKVAADLSQTWLAVDSPEQFRPQILAKLEGEIKQTTDRLGLGKTVISGLESPVLVRQVDEETVELFLNYKLSVEKE